MGHKNNQIFSRPIIAKSYLNDHMFQIDGKWALDLNFTLLLIPFSMLIIPFPLGCFKYTSLGYGHLNTISQSWKEKEVWSLLTLVYHGRNRGALEVHTFITLLNHVRYGLSPLVLHFLYFSHASHHNCLRVRSAFEVGHF